MPQKVRLRFIYFLPAILWFLVSVFLLFIPGSDIPKSRLFEILYFDKWVHAGMFGLLTLLWAFPFLYTGRGSVRLFIGITLFWIGFGVLVEFLQLDYAAGRSFDILDMVADAAGALIALGILILKGKQLVKWCHEHI